MRFSFVGDGHYCGDGGAELQRLWQLHPWKPIGGCDGRFVLRSEVLSACSLQDLCRDWQIATCTPVLRCCEAERDEGADAADCVRFVGGGGMLTYAKRNGVFVHTLNTESGLARKLQSMRGGAHAHVVRALGGVPAAPLFASLCAILDHVPEPGRTKVAPALAVALRYTLARAAMRPQTGGSGEVCEDCDEPPPSAADAAAPATLRPRSGPKRSVDYLLEGSSVVTNRHLARFAGAPYLSQLLNEPVFHQILNRTSRVLRKELIEAYVLLEALEERMLLPSCSQPAAASGSTASCGAPGAPLPPPRAIIDLCSGKGFLSLILALEFPSIPIIAVDVHRGIKVEHFEALPNLRFVRADIMASEFGGALENELDAATRGVAAGHAADASNGIAVSSASRSSCVALGMHLCGRLSPRAIEIFGNSEALSALVLVPCCLDKRDDALLKARARELRIDPYEAKIEELSKMLADAPADVTLVRGADMRTNGATEGGASCKNAILFGSKRDLREGHD